MIPTIVIEHLRGEIQMYRDSYREADGKVRNPGARRTIEALQEAIKIIRRRAKKP